MSGHCRKKLVIATEPQYFSFDLPKDTGNNLRHEICSIIKHNKRLAEHTIRNRIRQKLS